MDLPLLVLAARGSDALTLLGGCGCVVLVIAIIVLAWYFSPAQVIKRKLKKVPVRTLIEAGNVGVVRITGKVLADGLTLDTPLSGTRCAWYGAYVDEYRSSGKSGHWVQIIQEENCTEFLLDDGTGVARVRCITPQVSSPRDHETGSGAFDDASPVEEAFLRKHGRQSTGLLGFNRRIRYREAKFEAGETVTVLGMVRPIQDRQARYEIVPPDDSPMLMSDDPSAVK